MRIVYNVTHSFPYSFMIDYVSVLVAAVAAFVIGFLWHGPLFGKLWMKLSNITPEQMEAAKKQSMLPRILGAFVQQLVTAYVLAIFLAGISTMDWVMAVRVSFWIWLGFIAMTLLNGVLWENRTIKLYLFNIVYQLVNLCAMALIIGLWRW